jgi:inorganic pyrophosphatase
VHPWHDVPVDRRTLGRSVPAVIEIPSGSKNKYELDKATGLLRLDRVLHGAVHYPADYGFVPRTYCGDGDPLDVLVVSQEPVPPLTLVEARVLGVMRMRDEKGVDDKLIAVSATDPAFAEASSLGDLPSYLLREMKRLFLDYKVLEKKQVLVSDPLGRREALRILREALTCWDRTYGPDRPRSR